ncbi:hypothetical protein ABTE16_19860, partial [Acinetobacter baumannii]
IVIKHVLNPKRKRHLNFVHGRRRKTDIATSPNPINAPKRAALFNRRSIFSVCMFFQNLGDVTCSTKVIFV